VITSVIAPFGWPQLADVGLGENVKFCPYPSPALSKSSRRTIQHGRIVDKDRLDRITEKGRCDMKGLSVLKIALIPRIHKVLRRFHPLPATANRRAAANPGAAVP
jgi:hypothetical protein